MSFISIVRSSGLVWLLTGLVILFGVIALWQYQSAESLRSANSEAMEAFLEEPKKAAAGEAPNVLVNNTNFCWTASTCALIDKLSAKLAAYKGSDVYLDKHTSYSIDIANGSVHMNPGTFASMLNESIFNYPESALRDMEVSIATHDEQRTLNISGKIKLLLWIPFNLKAALAIEPTTNTLKIAAKDLKVLGVIPATWAIKIKPLNLEEVLPVPKNNHLSISDNTIFVKPFGLFPPPRITGKMDEVAIGKKDIHLTFKGTQGTSVKKPAKSNFIAVQGGTMYFTRLSMSPVSIALIDKKASDPFRFSLNQYAQYLDNSKVAIQPDHSVKVMMPDAT
jgi:hypothetical protein